MDQIAGWIAPIATTLAAIITAANLGARITGFGFIVFLVGSIAWMMVGYATDQANLLYQNGLLCVINAVGIWRWLGRQAKYETGAETAARESRAAAGPALFAVSLTGTADVCDGRGAVIGHAVDAMADCRDGRIRYLVVREGGVGGVGERLHAVPFTGLAVEGDTITVDLDARALADMPVLEADKWPGHVPHD